MRKNGADTIINNNTLWLNEKHIEYKLGHTNLSVLSTKYLSKLRKHRDELVNNPKKQPNIFFCMMI